MIGLALVLHFGLMQLAALAWQRAGVMAEPLMRQPARSTSLAEFWGRRWNTGFRFLAHDLLFRRLVRGLGIGGATAVVFFVSGIIHDAVISIPARGGYGLPTVYFLLQLVGVLAERSDPLKWVGRAPIFGWLYVFAFTVLPMPLLFHGPFIHNVVVPFLRVIGGLS
jgi:alginate O-acetyltransferase complex protein AlgI